MKVLCMAAACLFATLAGCGSVSPGGQFVRSDPDGRTEELETYWRLVDARAPTPELPRDLRGSPLVAKERILDEAEVLALENPRHVPVLMLCAGLSYDLQRPDSASFYLDALRGIDPTHPEAAILRSRIAIEQGNYPYAIRLLDEQVALSPDHAGLRETRASALFLAARFDEAVRDLEAAERLGAPKWRTSFNRGLIHEAQGLPHEAARCFDACLQHRSDYEPARRRLRGLETLGIRPIRSNG